MSKIPCPTFAVDRSNGREPKDWDGECCHFCGKPLSLKNRHYVHMTNSNELVNVKVPEETVENSQGWFPVGPVCKKKVPRGFSTKGLPWEK